MFCCRCRFRRSTNHLVVSCSCSCSSSIYVGVTQQLLKTVFIIATFSVMTPISGRNRKTTIDEPDQTAESFTTVKTTTLRFDENDEEEEDVDASNKISRKLNEDDNRGIDCPEYCDGDNNRIDAQLCSRLPSITNTPLFCCDYRKSSSTAGRTLFLGCCSDSRLKIDSNIEDNYNCNSYWILALAVCAPLGFVCFIVVIILCACLIVRRRRRRRRMRGERERERPDDEAMSTVGDTSETERQSQCTTPPRSRSNSATSSAVTDSLRTTVSRTNGVNDRRGGGGRRRGVTTWNDDDVMQQHLQILNATTLDVNPAGYNNTAAAAVRHQRLHDIGDVNVMTSHPTGSVILDTDGMCRVYFIPSQPPPYTADNPPAYDAVYPSSLNPLNTCNNFGS